MEQAFDRVVEPPFPLTRATMDALATGGLHQGEVEELDGPRWRVAHHR